MPEDQKPELALQREEEKKDVTTDVHPTSKPPVTPDEERDYWSELGNLYSA